MPRRDVLVVDDDDDVRRALAELLTGLGFHVEEASDGAQALRRLELRPPSLVVTDLDMPVVGGVALVREMRARPDLAAVPVIVVSSSRERASAADRQLAKPCRWEEVRRAVRELLEAEPRPR